ncbi:MAG TPA: hypothetical protein VK169_01375 [Saprospiraceae bacterium]|nr:hypothetical protein [Saprospiraceae bacterium]
MMLLIYFVQLEKGMDKVCNEIVKDYNCDLNRHFNNLKEASKMTETASRNANKIRPIIEKLLLVKNKEEADSMSIIAEEMIDKLGWNFQLKYENHKELGVSIIDQFIDKFELGYDDDYDTKMNVVINELKIIGDSIHIELVPVFINPNFRSFMINGVHEIHENPFFSKDSVQFVVFKSKRGRISKYSIKTKHDEE